MEAKLISIREYCKNAKVEVEFVSLLKAEDIIEVHIVDGEESIVLDQIPLLEQYARWYYEMEINLEGIDAIRHLLERVKKMQHNIHELESKLRLYEKI